jgi:hypothetical protein
MRFAAAALALALAACSLLYRPDPGDLRHRDAGEDATPDGTDVPFEVPADGEEPDAPPACDGTLQTTVVSLPTGGADILVVVDNSMGMSEEQATLMDSFPTLIGELLSPTTGAEAITDMHIGVVSTDAGVGDGAVTTGCSAIGDDGILLHEPSSTVTGCDLAYPAYLSTDEGSSTARVSIDFECIATLGTTGCGIERPFEVVERALDDHRGDENAGFVREDSMLLVLFITDENDCSVSADHMALLDGNVLDYGPMMLRCMAYADYLEPVQTFVDFLEGLRADRRKIQLGFLTGVPQGETCEGPGDLIGDCLDEAEMQEQESTSSPGTIELACNTSWGSATPGRRLVEMAQSFGGRAFVGSSCGATYGETFTSLVRKLQESYEAVNEHGLPVDDIRLHEEPGEECLCKAECTVREVLSDSRTCTLPKTFVELREDRGNTFTVCEIPQAGATLESCPGACNDPTQTFIPAADGWYYHPPSEAAGLMPILFSETTVPEPGSLLEVECCI